MKLMIGWIPLALFGVVSIPVSAQLAPDLAQLIPDPDAVSNLERLEWQATGQHFEPGQTVVAGVGSLHNASYTLQGTWEPSGEASYDWVLSTYYPYPSEFRYSETFASSGVGSVDGVDGFRPRRTGEMGPARVAARSKFLWMSVPALLLTEASDIAPISGQPKSFRFVALDTSWVVNLDAESGLPLQLSTTADDPIFGPVQSSVHYSAWQDVGSVMVPAQLEYRLDGDIIRREQRNELTAVMGGARDRPSYTVARSEPMFVRGWDQAHLHIRNIALAVAHMDTDPSLTVELSEVGDGVYQVLGSSHHNLVIEVEDGLVVVDAPLSPSRQEAVLEALEERWPEKPVRHLILSHHHYDHGAGLVTDAVAGVPITMHSLNRELFFDAFVRQGLDPEINGVGAEAHLEIGGRAIGLYEIPTVHAEGMLGVYIADERMLFINDIYSAGQEVRHPLWGSEALSAVRFLDVPVERVVGAHGRGTNTLAEMEAVVQRGLRR